MSDDTPVTDNTGSDQPEQTPEHKEKELEVKVQGFLSKTLSKAGEPSSKRVVAFISFLAGTIIGLVFSSFCIAMFVTPILNTMDISKVASLQPILNIAVDFIKFFIVSTFTLTGGALGITGLEAFANRLTK